jgi:5-formyltetrahydrofolate cyclo-ligase
LITSANSKDAQRQAAFQKRLRVPTAAGKQAAQHMMENFLRDVPMKAGDVIAGYWPVNAEINVLPLMVHLQHKGYACALPQVTKKNTPLVFRSWHEKTPMRANAYNIKEPDPTKSSIVRPDILIVPMLAFDPAGYRLGYGVGYYDLTLRYLKERGPVLAVGVAYDLQRIDRVLAESHDCTMDMIVTDKNVYAFEGNTIRKK